VCKNFWPTQTSHDLQYEANEMPTLASPVWSLLEGSESWASIQPDGTLRINDTGTGSGNKVKWARSWDATNTHGATVFVRARCAANSLDNIPDVTVQDGRFTEDFAILSNKVRALNANIEAALDGTQWHTYRITTQGTQFKVYVDEASSPVLTGALSVTTNRARIIFGSGSSPATQDIYYDYVYCFSSGNRGPAAATSDMTPDVTVDIADVAGKNSLSGVNPSTAMVYWSTDGGDTWKASGWECKYEADAMPSASNPAWTVAEGSESYGSVNSGVLRVNDNSTGSGSKIKWSRAWRATQSSGATVITRARCAAVGGDTTYLGNIYVDDGVDGPAYRRERRADLLSGRHAVAYVPLHNVRQHVQGLR